MKVRDLMSRPALTVSPQMPVRDVAAFFCRHQISGAPVTDGDGRLVGVISESDVVEQERGFDESMPFLHRFGRRPVRQTRTDALTAGDLMTSAVITTEPTMSDYGALWLMCDRDVNRLPVVDRGRVVEVVSRADLTREFARADSSIAEDIRTSVIDALPVPDVDVSVRDGRVVLTGVVDTEKNRDCLPHAVYQVPGVVAVDCCVRVRQAP
jgi:CBS-domain-containing membrane protein